MSTHAQRRWHHRVLSALGALAVVLTGGAAATAMAGPAEFERLHSFTGRHAGGIYVQGELLPASEGWIYGATNSGGLGDDGTIFRVKPDHTFETVTGFQLLQGRGPVGDLVEDGVGNLYGVTYAGGDYDGGTIFELHPDGTLEVLYSFNPAGWGGHPQGGVARGADGSLYGVLPYSEGTPTILYQLQSGGAWIPRAILPGSCADAYQRPVVDAAGNVYVGSISEACVIRVDPAGKTRILKKDRHQFLYGLMMAQDGNLYYTLSARRGNECGGIERMTPEGVISRVHTFACHTNNVEALNALVQTPDGLLHGSLTRNIGGNAKYTFYSMSTDGSGFTETQVPKSAGFGLNTLAPAPDGSVYAISSGAKALYGGEVIRITP